MCCVVCEPRGSERESSCVGYGKPCPASLVVVYNSLKKWSAARGCGRRGMGGEVLNIDGRSSLGVVFVHRACRLESAGGSRRSSRRVLAVVFDLHAGDAVEHPLQASTVRWISWGRHITRKALHSDLPSKSPHELRFGALDAQAFRRRRCKRGPLRSDCISEEGYASTSSAISTVGIHGATSSSNVPLRRHTG